MEQRLLTPEPNCFWSLSSISTIGGYFVRNVEVSFKHVKIFYLEMYDPSRVNMCFFFGGVEYVKYLFVICFYFFKYLSLSHKKSIRVACHLSV